nr:ATP-binding cassette domain-containing protein [uncultured Desulfobulbus sp.]
MKRGTKKDVVIAVHGLAKRFGELQAVADLNFEVFAGELFGFLGPNGAGKTTTINILTGLARPDTGTIRIEGIDCTRNPRTAQHLIGVVPDESNLYPELSGMDNLCFCAALYGINKLERRKRAQDLLNLFDLSKAANRKFSGYSKGMKRKLTIAAGIIHAPKILFLDEPTTGIDVGSSRQLRQLIDELHLQGTTIFLTTHYIEEAERLCDRVAFIKDGRIARIDTVDNLIQPIRNRHVMHITCLQDVNSIRDVFEETFPEFHCTTPQHDLLRIESANPVHVGPVVRFLEDHAIEVLEARRIRPSLEDVFVQVTGLEAATMYREKEKSGGKG